MPKKDPNVLTARLAKVKLLLCDVDGVLTNATADIAFALLGLAVVHHFTRGSAWRTPG